MGLKAFIWKKKVGSRKKQCSNLNKSGQVIYIYIYIYLYNKVDDEKPLNQNLKFHVINHQLNKFTKYDVTV